jgi:hypothetical protein
MGKERKENETREWVDPKAGKERYVRARERVDPRVGNDVRKTRERVKSVLRRMIRLATVMGSYRPARLRVVEDSRQKEKESKEERKEKRAKREREAPV